MSTLVDTRASVWQRGRAHASSVAGFSPGQLITGCSGLLLLLGLVMVLSASSVTSFASTGSSFAIFMRQAIWAGIGIPVFFIATRMPLRVIRLLGYPILFGSIALLLMVLVPHVGLTRYGATRWVGFGPIQIQPSEPAKLGLVLWGADLLARKDKLLRDVKHLALPLLPVTLLLGLLIMAEPDMGTTIIVLLVAISMLWVVGAPMRLFGAVTAFAAGGLALLAMTEPYRLARLTTFLHPFKSLHGSGWQAVQGIYALSSGGWWGLGLGASREKWSYLPNSSTDYIFAIIGEELGLVGTLFVVAMFAVIGYAGIRIARQSRDPFCRLASAGVVTWLLGQALINMGAVVGLLPITGIPLPLISFGGSSLVPELFALGMLVSFARGAPSRAARGSE